MKSEINNKKATCACDSVWPFLGIYSKYLSVRLKSDNTSLSCPTTGRTQQSVCNLVLQWSANQCGCVVSYDWIAVFGMLNIEFISLLWSTVYMFCMTSRRYGAKPWLHAMIINASNIFDFVFLRIHYFLLTEADWKNWLRKSKKKILQLGVVGMTGIRQWYS